MHAFKLMQQVELKLWLNGLQLLRVLTTQAEKTCLRSLESLSAMKHFTCRYAGA